MQSFRSEWYRAIVVAVCSLTVITLTGRCCALIYRCFYHSFNSFFSFLNVFFFHPCSLKQHIFSFCCLFASFLQPGGCPIILMTISPSFFLRLPASPSFLTYKSLSQLISITVSSLRLCHSLCSVYSTRFSVASFSFSIQSSTQIGFCWWHGCIYTIKLIF